MSGGAGETIRNKPSLVSVFTSGRMAVVLLTGFSCGMPYGLIGGTFQAWMKSNKVDLPTIGLLAAIVGMPYTLKFLWSPLTDRFVPPLLGRRRGWIVLGQLGAMIGLSVMAAVGLTGWSANLPWIGPVDNVFLLAAGAMLVAIFGATQDISVDAYRTEILQQSEYGAGAGVYIMGYRMAMIVSGAGSLILADQMPWPLVYLLMAGAMAVGLITTMLAPEPKLDVQRPRTLYEAVVLPMEEFLRRRGAGEILLFIFLYKLDVAIAQSMSMPFLLDLGFSQTEVGAVNNGFGLGATIVGAMIGGAAMARIGLCRSLWTFGLLQGVSGACFTLLAVAGKNYSILMAAVVIENVCVGMGTAAFAGFLMSMCDKRFTATQYALLTSLMALSRQLAGLPSGWVAAWSGWPMYFVISILAAAPGLALLTRYRLWTSPPDAEGAGPKYMQGTLKVTLQEVEEPGRVVGRNANTEDAKRR